MAEANGRDGSGLPHNKGNLEQTGGRAGAHVVSKQFSIVLATNFLNVTCQDANRIHSRVDRDLPEFLRANTASYCHAPIKLSFSSTSAPA